MCFFYHGRNDHGRNDVFVKFCIHIYLSYIFIFVAHFHEAEVQKLCCFCGIDE